MHTRCERERILWLPWCPYGEGRVKSSGYHGAPAFQVIENFDELQKLTSIQGCKAYRERQKW